MDDATLLDRLAPVRRQQDGVVTRRQVLAAGAQDHDVARLVRRRVLRPLHRGVYLDHTGAPTWREAAWAAVLVHEPAALAGHAALAVAGVLAQDPRRPVEVLVDRDRRVVDPPGVVSARGDLQRWALLHLSPPRVRVEAAALAVASRTSRDDAAVAVLAQACQSRATTPARLAACLDELPRLTRRALLREVLEDVATGAFSALERRYLVQVERAHGLPTGERQRPVAQAGRSAYRDVEYGAERLVVELDGRLGHDRVADRWLDLDRDVRAMTTGRATTRAGWAQVLQPCRLAQALDLVLRGRGWRGRAHPCGTGCDVGVLRARGA